MTCPFRDEAKRICTIYEVRPEICREFMCNHTTEDIMKAKIDMHQRKEVVMMRGRFFNSIEEQDMFQMFMNALTGQGD